MIEEKVGQPTFFMPIGKAMNKIERVRQIAGPTVKALGYEWVGCELQSSRPPVLRIYVDRENGVTLDDCAVVSRQLSALFDVENLMVDAYQLEISSPGLDRPLFTIEDYKKFMGRTANVQLSMPLEGRRNFKGVIVDVSSAHVLMRVENENFELPFAQIAKGKLMIEDKS